MSLYMYVVQQPGKKFFRWSDQAWNLILGWPCMLLGWAHYIIALCSSAAPKRHDKNMESVRSKLTF